MLFPIPKDYDNVDRYFLELQAGLEKVDSHDHIVTPPLYGQVGHYCDVAVHVIMCSCVMMVFVVKIMTTLSLRLSTGRFVIIAMIVFMCSCIINLKEWWWI